MEQQFSLSWREFQGNLSLGCARLLGSGEFADVTLAAEGQLLQAHRLVLSICSPYFQKMFLANPCQHPIVVLKDVSYRAMKSLLQFMYNGEVSVKQEDLTSFINTAETLEIKGLTNKHNNEEASTKINEVSSNFKKTNSIQSFSNTISETGDILTKNSDSTLTDKSGIFNQTSLKRKCDSLVQNNSNTNSNAVDQMPPVEKRTKLREKQILNRHKILNSHQKKSIIPIDVDPCRNEILRASIDSIKDSFNEYNSGDNSNESRFCEEIPDPKSVGNSLENINTTDPEIEAEVVIKKENGNDTEYPFEESPIRSETISVRNDLIENQVSRLSPGLDQHGLNFSFVFDDDDHWPLKGNRVRCRMCSSKGKETRTTVKCVKCGIGLCAYPCFADHLETLTLAKSRSSKISAS